jgi:hypothetical protein
MSHTIQKSTATATNSTDTTTTVAAPDKSVITDVIRLYDALLQYVKDMRALVVASVNASIGTTAGTSAAKQQAADDKLLSYTDAAEAW